MPNRPTTEVLGNPTPAWGSARGAGPLLGALAIVLLLFLLIWARYRPPSAQPATAPADQFSAVRAEAFLIRTLGDGQPHPVGSAADGSMRQAILAQLVSLGYQPHVERGFACGDDGVCAQVRNVLARLDGSAGGKAVLLVAHYDSVAAGPGASDDGSGVAASLEIARALKAGSPLRHPVIFLFDEGEEAGLLGAVAFIEQSPWAREVSAAVNLDARGTSGPSLMFETGGHSLWLMPLFARAVRRPLANSLYYAVYRRLPNDTDFSVFSRQGIDGFNFAFIGDVAHYHTPLDNLSYLDPRTLQSQGEHGLGAVQALANAGIGSQSGGGAVFFDVAAWRMIWWPVGWTLWLGALALVLLVACGWIGLRRDKMRARELAWGQAAFPAALVAAGLLGTGLLWTLRAVGAVSSGWVAHAAALVAAFWLLGLACGFVVSAWLTRQACCWGLWCGVWLWWGLLALTAAVALPEASFLWLAAALIAGVCGLAALPARAFAWRMRVAAILPAIVAALTTFEVALFLYPSLGVQGLPIAAVLMASLGVTFAPLFAAAPKGWRMGVTTATVAAAVVLAVVAGLHAPYTPRSPERMNVYFIQDGDSGRANWVIAPESGTLPTAMSRTASFPRGAQDAVPWFPAGAGAYVGDASPLNAAEPVWTTQSAAEVNGRLEIRGHIVSPRGAPVVALLFPPGVHIDSISVNGVPAPHPPRKPGDSGSRWHRYAVVTTPADGVDVAFAESWPPPQGAKEAQAVLLDESYGLPASGAGLVAARPAYAVQSQSGDVTILWRTIRFSVGAVQGPKTRVQRQAHPGKDRPRSRRLLARVARIRYNAKPLELRTLVAWAG